MKKKILALLLAVLMLLPATALAAGDAVAGTKGTYNGHSYMRLDGKLTWTEARAYCESLGGYLVCITSEEEQAFVESLLKDGTERVYWIGATDEAEEGVWEWISGEPFTFAHWGYRQPDNNHHGAEESYVGMSRQNESWAAFGRWNDFTNDGSDPGPGGFICEWNGVHFWSEASAWAVPEMEKAAEMDLVPEVLVGKDLKQAITRAEFAAVAVKTYEALSGVKAIPIVNNPFTDCADVEVLKAYGIGAVNGTGPATFSPDQLLNREQAATMLTRVFKRITLSGWTLETDGQFTLPYTMPAAFADDGEISAFARDSVYFMAANGIINGISGNKFAPKNVTSAQEAQGYANATREQALAIAVRMVENLK